MKRILILCFACCLFLMNCNSSNNSNQNETNNLKKDTISVKRVDISNLTIEIDTIISSNEFERFCNTLYYYDSKLFSGVVFEKYVNGQIREEYNVKNGKLNGKYKGFFDNGKLSFEVDYNCENGIGFGVTYYSTGVIKQKTKVENFNFIEKSCFDKQGNEIECD